MKIALLSNVNVNMIIQRLSVDADIYYPEGYNTWVQDLLQSDSNLYKFNPHAIFILVDGYEIFKNVENVSINNIMDQYISYVENSVKCHSNITYFISNIDIPLKKLQAIKSYRIEKEIEFLWYKKLYDLSEKYSNLYIFDIKKIIEEMGRDVFYSNKVWYLSGSKYSVRAEKHIIKLINQHINALLGKRKKCLVLDLDNTLWGGVVGEDGINGISLSDNKEGARYKDFQKRIKEIKDTGIILSIVSKNNYDDALEVMRSHSDMVLKENDFVGMKINWNVKPQNIEELSEELNIGKESFVFIDDNPVERNMVANEIPEVSVPEFPADTCELERYVVDIYNEHFLILDVTNEDKKKTEMYVQNFKRSQEQKQYSTIDEYLKSLETEIHIRKARTEDIHRVAQLSQKTNQFNLTTKRYTELDIHNMINSDKYLVYVASVKDKFGDNGQCVVVIVEKKDYVTVNIDTFIMSCRVMGRFIEDSIISYIERDVRDKGFDEVRAYYYPTKKNIPVKDLFDRLGYDIINVDENNGNKDYKIKLTGNVLESLKRKNSFSKTIIS